MTRFKLISDPAVDSVFNRYLAAVRLKLLNLRLLILENAGEIDDLI